MRTRITTALAISAFACGDLAVGSLEPADSRDPVRPAPVSITVVRAPPAHPVGPERAVEGYDVQEWGTFTSVQASDGHALPGLHHEDETLPSFVERRNWSDRNNYYFETLPEEPLQQLETPVLYFWSDEARRVDVRVDFPQGVVGQWYPVAAAFEPQWGELAALANGWMRWTIDLDPSLSPASFPPVDPDEIWAPSRRVASTPVQAVGHGPGHQVEQFIFYRGLGRFDPDVRVRQRPGARMEVVNASTDDLPAVFVLHAGETGGRFETLGPLGAGETRSLDVPTATLPADIFVADARSGLEHALLESGLKADVARAMVDTWTRSWFGNEGLRVLYVAPRSWADTILPTVFHPDPRSFVRTFVGRIESLTPESEDAVLAALRSEETIDPPSLGRFAEPRLARALEVLPGGREKDRALALLEATHDLP